MPTTSNYSVTLPTVGSSTDTWGAENNAAHEAWDAQIKAVDDKASGALPKTGGTLTGPITGTSATFSQIAGPLQGNADTASKLAAAYKIGLSGPLQGWARFDGSKDVSIAVAVPDNAFAMSSVTGLVSGLAGKMPTTGGAFAGDITRSGRGGYLHHADSSLTSGRITVSSAAPSGGSNGDVWYQV